jgi:hypothetical protein
MTDIVDAESGYSGTARLETLSDGVFAIAITILVLEIKVPSPAETAAFPQSLPSLLSSPGLRRRRFSPSVRRPCGGCGVCRVFGCGGLAPRR